LPNHITEFQKCVCLSTPRLSRETVKLIFM